MTTKEVEAVIDELEKPAGDNYSDHWARGLDQAADILRAALHKSRLAAIERKTARKIRALDTLPSRKLS